MHKLVLVRHGESEWNKKNLFTGWTDVDLSEKGHEEAREAGRKLKEAGYEFDRAYTSYLKRAIHTLNHILDETDENYIPVEKSWKLNERHYGALQGLNKAETAARYGEEQVHEWRRAFDVLPPALEDNDPRNPNLDRMYRNVEEQLPEGESLKTTIERVVPYYEEVIAPKIADGETIIIAAHGNSLRALVKHLDNISDEDIASLNIPTGIPLVYELDDALHPVDHYYLADDAELKASLDKVKAQGKAN